MKALIEKYGPWAAGALAFVFLIVLLLRGCTPTPKPDVIQQAAQDAASAIVTVEHADTALARHHADSVAIATLTVKYQADSITRVSLQRRLALVEKNIPAKPDVVDGTLASPVELAAQWEARADTAMIAVALADSVIAQDSVTNHDLTVVNDSLRSDNALLASNLSATRSELAKHRTVVIPAGASTTGFHFPNPLKLLTVTIGYGTQYDVSAKHFSFGPQATLGVRIPL